MGEAHEAMKDAYKSTNKLILKLSTRGMGVLLEALMTDDSKYRPVGKIAAAVAVYLRYAMGEEMKDVKLTMVGKVYPIGERQVRKVVTGKLYDTKGENRFLPAWAQFMRVTQ